MEMTYEELSSRLKDIDSKLDDLFSLIGKLTASRQCELMDVPAIAEMLGLSKRDIQARWNGLEKKLRSGLRQTRTR